MLSLLWWLYQTLAAWTLIQNLTSVPCSESCVSCDLRCCPWLVFMRPNECLCILWPALINIDETLGLLTRTFPERLDYDPCMLTHESAWRGTRGVVRWCFSAWTSQHCITSHGNITAQKMSSCSRSEVADKWSWDKREKTLSLCLNLNTSVCTLPYSTLRAPFS